MSSELGQAPEPNQNAAFLQKGTSLRVIDTGTLSLTHTIGGSTDVITTTVNATHDLGYKPAFIAYITLDSGIMSGSLATSNVPNPYPILYTLGGGATLTLMGQAEVYVDTTKVYFSIRTDSVGGGPYICSAKYYLFAEDFV